MTRSRAQPAFTPGPLGGGENERTIRADPPALFDPLPVSLPEEAPRLAEVRDLLGIDPIRTAPIVSVATGSLPKISTPAATGSPEIGPFPSMPTMPSMIAYSGRTAPAMSRIDRSIPAQCRMFFGHP